MTNLLFLLAACQDQASFDPTADAGFDQLVAIGGNASLDGSGSFDQDGFVTAYQWSILAAPEGSAASAPAAGESTTFTPDLEGTYTLSLVVEDDDGNSSAPDIVTVTASAGNGRPDAVLSTSSLIQVGAPILLDGSASNDPEGDALQYFFSVQVAPSGSTAALSHSGETAPTAEFVPDIEGVYVLGLEVDDGTSRSTRADLTLTVTSEGNQPPIADCGENQAVDVGQRVQLNGGASVDPEGEPLTYSWTLSAPGGSAASLNDPSAVDPSFDADAEGTYRAELSVSDGALESTCSVRVDAGDVGNLPPSADAGSDEPYSLGETVTLDGSATSDPEGDPLSITWQFVSQPTGSALGSGDIQNADTLNASFTPDKAGTWLVQIAVCDEEPLCDTDTVQFEVEGDPGNNPPVADAGADVSGNVGDTLSADASGSSDPDGDTLSYTWTLDSAPSGSARTTGDIAAAGTATPRLNLDVSGRYVLSVEVCDPSSACDTDTMTMSAGAVSNTAPIAEAGADQTVTLGDTVVVDGSGSSDPDGDAITYFWGFNSVPSGSAVAGTSYADRTAVSTSFVPDVAGTYTVKLRVDDASDKDTDTFTLTVDPASSNTPPVADAGADQDLCGAGEISLDGTGSSDADGDALTYTWVFISVPSGSALVNGDITDRKTSSASFTPDAEGTFSLRLTTKDPAGDSDTDRVDIEVGDDGALLILHMDETSGTTVTDSSWGANDGTATNGDWLGARVFGGMDYDQESVIVPYSSDLALTSDFTIEWWMRPDGSGTGFESVFMKEDSTGSSYQFATFLNGTQMYFYGLSSGGGGYIYLLGTPSLDGDWHHYAITYDSSYNGVMYEDGTAIATATGTGAMSSSTGDLVIGDYTPYPGYYDFSGRIDEFIIHDTALSSSEVSTRSSDTTQFCTGDADVDPPTASITSPSTGSSNTDGVVAVEGTASDDSEITSLTVGGSNAVSTSGNFDTWVAYVDLADGSNTIEVDTEDIAGNTDSAVDSITVSYSDTCFDDYSLFLSWDEDTGATASDYSDNGLDATESGTDRVIGVYGNSATFDGSSYASIAHDAALSYSGAFTADFWYKRDGATSDVEVLFHKGVYNYAAALDGSDLFCLVRDSASTDWTVSASGYNDGDWHHVVCNYTGSKLRLYVDGTFEDIVTVGSTLSTNSDDFYVGAANGSAYFFEGELDDLRIRESNYTGTELKALYSEGEVCTISDNLAPDGTATASSNLSANYTASNVIDEQVDEDDYADETYWLLRTGSIGFVTIELADYVGVTRLRWVNTTHGPRYSFATKDYEIYASYNGEFNGEEELIASGTGDLETNLRYHQEELSTPVAAKYIRFYVDSYYSTGGGVNEIEVYGLE